jgi:glycosyltransferase A (GT-A) superfamily protein (DUF2064 family)
MKSGAIAVFVKTPGLSPIKTRLAHGIGREAAEEFYNLSCKATQQLIEGFSMVSYIQISPFWAVAEEGAMKSPNWESFPTIYQGEGALGNKLHHVYSQLLKNFDYVIVLGGDCPQAQRESLIDAADRLAAEPGFILGDSHDGGFWLFGGNRPVPEGVWLKTPYSVSNTASVLRESLQAIAPVMLFPRMQDVDYVENLPALKRELINQQVVNPAQSDIIDWLTRRSS